MLLCHILYCTLLLFSHSVVCLLFGLCVKSGRESHFLPPLSGEQSIPFKKKKEEEEAWDFSVQSSITFRRVFHQNKKVRWRRKGEREREWKRPRAPNQQRTLGHFSTELRRRNFLLIIAD